MAFRMRRDVVADGERITLNELLRRARIEWHGVALDRPDWSDHSHSLALSITSLGGSFRLHLMLNAYWEPLRFELPPAAEKGPRPWRRWIDTSLPSPADVLDRREAPVVSDARYLVQPRSLALLVIPLADGKE